MQAPVPKVALLEVNTPELTQALKHLLKCEPRTKRIRLAFQSGNLTFSSGLSDRVVPAQGTWPQPGFVVRRWAESLSRTPYEAAVTTLEVKEEKLWARSFGTLYVLDTQADRDEDAIRRQKDIAAAVTALARHGVTVQDIRTLVKAGDTVKAGTWGVGETSFIDHVATVWMQPDFYAVEPADIRRLLVGALQGNRQEDLIEGGVLGRYNVTRSARTSLIAKADTKNVRLWARASAALIAEIGAAWKNLVFYGVAPLDILHFVNRKSRVSTRRAQNKVRGKNQ